MTCTETVINSEIIKQNLRHAAHTTAPEFFVTYNIQNILFLLHDITNHEHYGCFLEFLILNDLLF